MAEEPQEGERVVLGTKGSGMTPFPWSGNEPPGLRDVEWAEELGTRWEGDYLPDND